MAYILVDTLVSFVWYWLWSSWENWQIGILPRMEPSPQIILFAPHTFFWRHDPNKCRMVLVSHIPGRWREHDLCLTRAWSVFEAGLFWRSRLQSYTIFVIQLCRISGEKIGVSDVVVGKGRCLIALQDLEPDEVLISIPMQDAFSFSEVRHLLVRIVLVLV